MWGKVKTIFRKNKLFLFSSIQNEKNKQKNRIILKLFVFLQKITPKKAKNSRMMLLF